MVRRIQGWDPVLIISQIISLQTLHYLFLSLAIPPIVTVFTSSKALTYAGGPYNKGYVLDWREIASRSTAKTLPRHPPAKEDIRIERRLEEGTWPTARDEELEQQSIQEVVRSFVQRVSSVGRRDVETTHYAVKDDKDDDYEVWDYGVSRKRGWLLSMTWVMACVVDIIPLYYLIRKPTLILDFSLTLLFNHVVITTYKTGSIPTSFWFWVVMLGGSLVMVIGAEQLCVTREMNEGLGAQTFGNEERERLPAEEYELDDR